MELPLVAWWLLIGLLAPQANSQMTDESSGPTTTESGEFQCTAEGYFNDPKSCRAFYRCAIIGYMQKYHFSCAYGAVFDEAYSVCVHPWQSSRPECLHEYDGQTDANRSDGGQSSTTDRSFRPSSRQEEPENQTSVSTTLKPSNSNQKAIPGNSLFICFILLFAS